MNKKDLEKALTTGKWKIQVLDTLGRFSKRLRKYNI